MLNVVLAAVPGVGIGVAPSQAHAIANQGALIDLNGLVLPGLVIGSAWYAAGIVRLLRNSSTRRNLVAQGLAFGAGIIVVGVSLLGPLDAASDESFAAHMFQHMLLMLVAAPLFVLAEPMPTLLAGLPRDWRVTTNRARRKALVRQGWHRITHPGLTLVLYGAVLAGWHVPRLYDLALRSSWVHAAEHLSFLAVATLAWWVLLARPRHHGLDLGRRVLYVFVLMLQGTALSAVYAFSERSWYEVYAHSYPLGWTPLQDQQIGGVVMGVMCGIIYAGVAALLFLLWLAGEERAPGTAPRRAAPPMPPALRRIEGGPNARP